MAWNFSVRGSLAWEEVEVPGGNPCVQAANCDTLSHTTTVGHGDQTMVTVVRREHTVHCTAWTTRGYTKGTSLAFFILNSTGTGSWKRRGNLPVAS